MPDASSPSTPQVVQPGNQKRTEYQPSGQWAPIYADYADRVGGGPVISVKEGLKIEDTTTQEPAPRGQLHHSRIALPVGWKCPCGEMVFGSSCKCGRIPRDTVPGKLNSSQRCTTGRQGRSWKRIGRGGRC